METVAGLERSFNIPAKLLSSEQLRCAVLDLGVFAHGVEGNVAPSTTIYSPKKVEISVVIRNECSYVK